MRGRLAFSGWLRLIPAGCGSLCPIRAQVSAVPFRLVWRVFLGTVGVAERIFDAPLGYLVLAAEALGVDRWRGTYLRLLTRFSVGPSSSLPIVQLAATASRAALRAVGRDRLRRPLDPAPTHQDSGIYEETDRPSDGRATARRDTLTCVNGRQGRTGTAVAWYDVIRNHWRWYCSLCNEERRTTSIERDHDGPVQTFMRTHIDHFHAGDDVTVEIKNADGDIDEDGDD